MGKHKITLQDTFLVGKVYKVKLTSILLKPFLYWKQRSFNLI